MHIVTPDFLDRAAHARIVYARIIHIPEHVRLIAISTVFGEWSLRAIVSR